MKVRIASRWVLPVSVLAIAAMAGAQSVEIKSLAPYVPSPHKVVERMLEIAEVKPTDTVYDLGSGDGRILVTAVQKFGARAVGIEIDPDLAKKSEARLQELALDNRAKVIQANLLDVDLSPASVVTLYLLTSANTMLKPNLEKSLKPGSRVVSHDFQIDGWTPVKTERVRGDGRTHTIYLYEIGKQ
jgi:Ribosomal RNA adenine dimethylase